MLFFKKKKKQIKISPLKSQNKPIEKLPIDSTPPNPDGDRRGES